MTNPLSASGSLMSGDAGSDAPARPSAGAERFPWLVLAAYCLITMIGLILTRLPFAKDYVGSDNDDVMRLVEIRDLLAGQGWFDMTQYRLGLDGGTLMHWSRFIDMPIANLITFFSLFLSPQHAEAVALAVWPLALVVPFFYGMALAGRRLGGRPAMHATLGLSFILTLSLNRFQPGSIDHHNVQIALAAIIAAMLLDPAHRRSSLAIAGVAAGLAIAIGAETMPLIAMVCVAVAVTWAWHGAAYSSPARAFGLSLGATVSAAFFLTVPPNAYATVTCDNLSFGFYSLATFGGCLLFLAAAFFSGSRRPLRFAALAGIGVLVGAAAIVIAPQCLQNPLSNLDPMLVSLWLSSVIEAQSVVASFRNDLPSFATFYAVAPLAIAVCLYRIYRGRGVEAYLVLLGLIATCYGVGLVQVRGTVIANVLATLPLAAAIADARAASNANPGRPGYAIGFILLTLASVPAVWAVAGLALPGRNGETVEQKLYSKSDIGLECTAAEAMSGLAQLPKGVVAGPSTLGASILRYTGHRALSGPYHRNQGGMLTELHIGLSNPQQAEAFLRGAGVTIIAFCASDAPTQQLATLEPDGLYARLMAGKPPEYLKAVGGNVETGLTLFQVISKN